MTSLDAETIRKLLNAKPARTGGRRKPKTLEREYDVWFDSNKVYHYIDGYCEVEDCVAPDRPPIPDSRMRVVAEIGGIKMCRHCFLAGAGDLTALDTTLNPLDNSEDL